MLFAAGTCSVVYPGDHNETLVAAALDRRLLRCRRNTALAERASLRRDRLRGPCEARAPGDEDHARRARAGRRLQGARRRSSRSKVPALCRVTGTVAPAINFEVWLPEGSTWNGRFQAVGGGGLAGIISYPAMAEAVRNGYASSSTDTGHVSTDTAWLLDRQRIIDYGYRAIHEMTVKAKAVIETHYGRAAEYSYFNGCSTGGRQGLMTAQRFPDDYDGIVSGAPCFASRTCTWASSGPRMRR